MARRTQRIRKPRDGTPTRRQARALAGALLALAMLLLALTPLAFPAAAAETISGTCTISNGSVQLQNPYYHNERMFSCDVRFAETGITCRGWCYEHEQGLTVGSGAPGPAAGSYRYTGTPNGDGTYTVIVHSEDSAGHYPGTWPYHNGVPVGGYVDAPSVKRQNIIVHDYAPNVTVSFTKTSTDAKISDGNAEYAYAGATYEIHRASDGALVTTVTTDENGHATAKLAPSTHYYAVEVAAPSGFVLNPERIEFDSGTGSAVSLPDAPGTVRLRVKKRDSATHGKAQAGATLEGAEYLVVDANGVSHTAVTDAEGAFEVSNLPLGETTVRETRPSTGYKLDPTVYSHVVTADELGLSSVVELAPDEGYEEHPIAFDIEIAKFLGTESPWDETTGSENPAAGIRFEIVSNTTGDVVGEITTGDDGYATTEREGLWFGAGERVDGIEGAVPYDAQGYTVREVAESVPEGFDRVDDWEIAPEEMVDGATLRYIVNDAELTGRLGIVKVDASSGLAVPLEGFSFQILDEAGDPVTMTDHHPSETVTDTFTTDETGSVTLPERLPSGTYTVHEVAARAPYLLSSEDVIFEVSGDHETASPTVTVTFSDEQATGRAILKKTCNDPDAHAPGQDQDAPCSLEGAEFDVVAMEDVISPDGTVHALEGQIVDHVVTDEEGAAKTCELSLGDGDAVYAFVETKPAAGHVLDATPHEFTLAWKDQSTAEVEVSCEIANAPTETVIEKLVAGAGDPLGGAEFALWSSKDELILEAAGSAVAVRAEGASSVSVRKSCSYALVTPRVPDGFEVTAERDGSTPLAMDDTIALEEGTWTLAVQDRAGAVIDLKDPEISVSAGTTYELEVTDSFFTGISARLEETGTVFEDIALDRNEEFDAFCTTDLDVGSYLVIVDGTPVGTLDAHPADTTYAIASNDGLEEVPVLLKNGAEPWGVVSDEQGRIVLDHLEKGTYRIAETRAPEGFVVDGDVRSFTIDEDGMTEGLPSHAIEIDNDYTKIDLSKRDATTEDEIPGASLAVLDSEGEVVDSWVSTTEEHRIDALAPGDYTLVEELTPHTYDEATSVSFTVAPTGEVQRVVMYDEPIRVTGDIDKRQEIATPTAEGASPDLDVSEGGSNRADPAEPAGGTFDYSVDFRSTSSTWVDEFTVTDTIDAAVAGAAELTGITTPAVTGDCDGTFNVWYTTNLTDPDYLDDSEANATLTGDHSNPWLEHDSVRKKTGADGRVVDYTGWRLWIAGADAASPQALDAHELPLAEGEIVTAVRLEYGRVEPGFTSREGDWEREDLKDPHDDLGQIDLGGTDSEASDEDPDRDQASGEASGLAPLVLHMRVTDAYRDDMELANEVSLDLYRNGGNLDGETGLEDHDGDRVVQKPRPRTPSGTPEKLASTGAAPVAACLTAGAAAMTAYAVYRLSGRRGRRT